MGMWQVCDRHVMGMWQVCDRHVMGIWQVCGRHVMGMWQVCDRHVMGMWQVCDRHVMGMWQVCMMQVLSLAPSAPQTLFREAGDHKAQLTGVIIAGHTLESTLTPPSGTPPDLGYKTLEGRYNDMLAELQDRVAGKRAAIGQVSDLLNKLRQLSETLSKWDHSLETHEPVSILPSAVEQQLSELAVSIHILYTAVIMVK